MKHTHREPLLAKGGFTLIELIIVIGIVVLLAGIVLGRLDGANESGFVDASFSSLGTIRQAIAGTSDIDGFVQDLGEPPAHLGDLLLMPVSLPSGRITPTLNPVTGLGWNGPYLSWYGDVYRIDATRGFTSNYGADGSHTVYDAWRRPIVLQWPAESTGPLDLRAQYIRLVSAGPNGVLETPADVLDLDLNDESVVGDDLATWVLR